jgi:2-pyrone-4,6-dicarboxylate lactonase
MGKAGERLRGTGGVNALASGEGDAAPLCAGPDPAPRTPRLRLPPGSCDTHAHICGPALRYPYFADRVYTPPDALLPQFQHLLQTLGMDRAVLVQPSVYAADNSVLLSALQQAGPNYRGVAVIDESVSAGELERMHGAGVRGVRINIVDLKDGKGVLPVDAIRRMAERIAPLGWHIEFLIHVNEFPQLERDLSGLEVPLVFGHMGYLQRGSTIATSGFKGLLALARSGRAWVKLTGPYRISQKILPYADTDAFAAALLDAAPAQIVWGSDWPHVMMTGPMPNDGDLCDLLEGWIPDQELRHKVMVENPARLYDFPEAA